MMYVFDTSAFSFLFRNIFSDVFTSMWQNLDILVEDGRLTSTLEVYREISDSAIVDMRTWTDDRKYLFPAPTPEEAEVVRKILAIPHFQQLIGSKNLQKGGKSADPWIIARAKILKATVITTEKWKPNSAKIPNVCDRFNVAHDDVRGFMKRENWKF